MGMNDAKNEMRVCLPKGTNENCKVTISENGVIKITGGNKKEEVRNGWKMSSEQSFCREFSLPEYVIEDKRLIEKVTCHAQNGSLKFSWPEKRLAITEKESSEQSANNNEKETEQEADVEIEVCEE